MAGTIYKAITYLFKSIGLWARDAVDRMPEHSYLNLDGCLERGESSFSSRYGSVIINRDPVGVGVNNYLFPAAPVTLSRLKALNGTVYRYAALADGSLYRRATDTQGAYTQILPPGSLSGLPFTTLVVTMYQSATPYLMFCDSKAMYKDNGTLTPPQRLGIIPPTMPAISAAYAPVYNLLSNFSSPGSFIAGGGLTIGTYNAYAGISAGYYGPQLGGNHFMYTWSAIPDTPCPIPDGTLVFASFNEVYGIKFSSDAYSQTFHYVTNTGLYAPADAMHQEALTTTTPSSSTGTITYTFSSTQNLSDYQPADLIVIVMRVDSPADVSSVSINFDVAGSDYTSSYYTRTLIPATYQGFITDPLSTDASTALTDAVLLDAVTGQAIAPSLQSQINNFLGVPSTASNTPATPATTPAPTNPSVSFLPSGLWGNLGSITANQPSSTSQLTTPSLATSNGATGAWSVIYLQKGDFLPVGNAGEPGLDWTVITGFRVSITTNTSGGTDVEFNSLYIQGNPTSTGVGTNAGPSSYGGVGYDFRYIYFNANTGTPSNPSPPQLFNVTPINPGGSSTLVVLRQAIDVVGQYSTDTQVTHVQLFARGGLYGDNWRYVDQIPNLPSSTSSESISYIAVSGTTVTITTSNVNVFTGNINLSGLTTYTALNGQNVSITAILSPSEFTFTFPGLTGTITIAETGTVTPGAGTFPGAGLFNSTYILPDTALQQGQQLGLANDVPVTTSLQSPINTTLSSNVSLAGISPNINYPILNSVTTASASATFVVNQIVAVGNPSNLELVDVVIGGTGSFWAFFQFSHVIGEPVQAFSQPAQPVTLSANAYGLYWWAGDPNNPHYLYYNNAGYAENVSPANYIPCGVASDPISAVINKRGTLFVRTYSTWYQVFSGNPPYAQSTGSKHGSTAMLDWGDAEGEIYYGGLDGIRTFRGSDGDYRSLPIEWLWRDNNLTPVELIDTTQLSKVLGAYNNNTFTFVYIGQDGNPHRLLWDTQYKRWRNDDVPVTAQYVEQDTNTLVYSKFISIPTLFGPQTGWVVVYDSYSQDYDDGGWSPIGPSGYHLVKNSIPITIQTPYLDVGSPNNQKQWNTLTIDANPNGQVLSPKLLFDGNNGSVLPVTPTPSTFTGSIREKFEFQINAGLGQAAYELSLQITGSVIAAPIIYQAEMYAAVLADSRSSYDTYWVHLGNNDETKLVKQCFVDYTTAAGVTLTLSLYHDGIITPYFTFTLPTNTARMGVPMRVRFPAQILRQFRMVIISNGNGSGEFQLWSPIQLEWKMLSQGGQGYTRTDLGDTQP